MFAQLQAIIIYYGKLLFMISLFSEESIVGHHLLWLLWKCAFIMQLGLIIHH